MVRSGESVTLSCHYDLEGLALYTIQWFFNDREFYRFIPDRKPSPPYSIFDVDGIQVNVSNLPINKYKYVQIPITYEKSISQNINLQSLIDRTLNHEKNKRCKKC